MKKLVFIALGILLLATPARAESAYDRVMRTQTIRCGYFLWPPFLQKDANTGQFSGVSYDLVEEMGRQLNLKIVWAAEINMDSMFEGYANGRYDMICGPLSPLPSRARASAFMIPFVYSPLNLYVRAGDARFDNHPERANEPSIRFAALDGEFSAQIAKEDFGKAQYISVPQMGGGVQQMITVATGKADATVTDPMTANKFMAENPGKIRQAAGPPLRVLSIAMSVAPGDERLKDMLDITMQNLLDTGFVERTLKKYPEADKAVLRIAKPYENRK